MSRQTLYIIIGLAVGAVVLYYLTRPTSSVAAAAGTGAAARPAPGSIGAWLGIGGNTLSNIGAQF